MYLDRTTFSTVIENTPLVSIDLIVLNSQVQALLGHRLNKPALGSWFVPGGRILKNENIETAFKRLTKAELGIEITVDRAELQGPFTHLYDDCVFGDEFGTHYVAIAYRLVVDGSELNLPINDQHNAYKWFSIDNLLKSKEVHLHTKWYFKKNHR